MTPAEIMAWISAAEALTQAGIMIGTNIGNFVRSLSPGATDEELNEIVQGIIQRATDRRALIAQERAALRQLPGWVEPEDGDTDPA